MAKRYVSFGSAWKKTANNDGTEFVSVSVKSKGQDGFVNKNAKTGTQTKTKIWLQIGEADPVLLEGFTIFPSGADKDRYPTAPDYSVTASFED
jgi:hypothetical protein